MSDPDLAPLQLVDRLEIGRPRIEPRRLEATYTVERQGREQSCRLAFRYEQPVFDPDDPAAQNLAAMIVAQPALNYGLFCREIVFRGELDADDRAFLEAMATITARDIYVRKLLRPKPYHAAWVRSIPLVERDSYLLARLRFVSPEPAEATCWRGDPRRVAILASGGKDSLLSHRLLADCGVETHPVFVNESGKHWFTAVSAYRRYAAEVEHTARVWTSSDRLFAFMLRQLPFVEPRWARHGLNGYPVRVWTLPVFLFAVLPLLHRRGVGALAVGNEYDTTIRGVQQGIAHRFCLYDQSRDFELELNAYLERKNWGFRVFSALRPCSGLLIQKQLCERYPDALRHQMSCHRAHAANERMRPCGRCEKCAGVIAMLLAFGRDPEVCGYSREQIERCLDELPEKGPWIEPRALRHLGFLLAERGLLRKGTIGGREAERCPEVMQLRFDDDAAALEDLPCEIRAPLVALLLEGAEGALRWRDDGWVELDPLAAG